MSYIEKSMSDNSEILNEKERRFSDYLTSRHLRKTPERFEILRCALLSKGHFDADSLRTALEEKAYHVSKATVYSALKLLTEARIIRKLIFDTHQARYEIAEDTHSHLICTHCGDIREIEMDYFDKQIDSHALNGFSLSYISTCIYGICEKCMAKTSLKRKD